MDGWIEFDDGYEKNIIVNFLPEGRERLNKQYIEINIDETKRESKYHTFRSSVIRLVPVDVVRERERNEMFRTASVDPTALAITRDGMDRVDNNLQREFEYRMEDNSGNKHY